MINPQRVDAFVIEKLEERIIPLTQDVLYRCKTLKMYERRDSEGRKTIVQANTTFFLTGREVLLNIQE